MPIVDGLTSTKMIRSHEKAADGDPLAPTPQSSSAAPARHGRIPIFAVSASLVESKRSKYIDAGFDGWVLKPVDFKRLSTLLEGILDQTKRDACCYKPGKWEQGGWFHARQYEAQASETKPAPEKDVGSGPEVRSVPKIGEDVIGDEQRRLKEKDGQQESSSG